ncbi:MAG: TerD family protein [Thermoflexibacteraceae bacterium]|jgi:tellurium resistance protein TerZ
MAINLNKGSRISLEKEGKRLEEVCIGLNWGVIKKKSSFFGLIGGGKEDVDLDGSVSLFNDNKKVIETVSYRKLKSSDGAIIHSGDDRSGDSAGDDGKDNEVIQINLPRINADITQIVFFLNSFKGQDFADIPYSKIRIFEGNKNEVKSVFATFNLSAEPSFAGSVSMIMGKLTKKPNGNWEFIAIGEAVKAANIDETIKVIQQNYLS